MSAICGFVAGQDGPEEDLAAMLETLEGYGEASSVWSGWPGTGLALRSSPVIKRGRSSALHEDPQAGIALAADIRLDNRRELADALGVPPSEREELDDAAFVLRAFKRWGRDCPDRLLGDFAFAVFDARKRELFCARDPLGLRPLFYALLGRRLVFASSIQGVLAAPGVPADIDETRIAALLLGKPADFPADGTFFPAVSKLEPGHSMAFANGRASFRRHWRPERVPDVRPPSDEAAIEELLDLLDRAVRCRCVGGPVGVEVSGGLDSTAIVALAARELEQQQLPAPVGFSMLPAPVDPVAEKYRHEYEATTMVAESFGLPLHYQSFAAEERVKDIRARALFPGQGYPRVVPLAGKLGTGVLLSGLGGDQGSVSHNGFGYFHQLLLRGQWRRFAKLARELDRPPLKEAARTALGVVSPRAFAALHRLWRRQTPKRRSESLIDRDFAASVRLRRPKPKRPFGIRHMQLRMLRESDMSSSFEHCAAQEPIFGVERRFPMLDRRVVEFGLGLPPDYYLRGAESRWLMRRAVTRLLPAYDGCDAGKEDRGRSDASRVQVAGGTADRAADSRSPRHAAQGVGTRRHAAPARTTGHAANAREPERAACRLERVDLP